LVSQTAQGKRCLLIIDEAQNLTARSVEELRMLSNFQFGNQSLLQSFLVGQPEFREILQRPEMEQFRQRVAATCHIGALDPGETQGYIEHRLKCAGSTGLPTFEPAAFASIHAASRGIPRRINTLCDRLLLLGFLAERTHLTDADVAEVASEFAHESEVPARRAPLAVDANGQAAELDLDMSRLNGVAIDDSVASDLMRQFGSLGKEQGHDQLQRLERSVLRLERISIQTLSALQRLIEAIKKSPEEPGR
jgi:hypothetical protein